MNFKEQNIFYSGRRSYGTESNETSTSTSVAGGSGGGGLSGRYIPYSINDNGDWVIENGYSIDDSGNTVFGANLILKGNFISEGEVAAYASGVTSGGTGGGDTVEWSQHVTDGVNIATISINGVDTEVYAPQGGSGGGSYSAGSGISINSSNVISISGSVFNLINSKQDAISDLSTIRNNASSGKTAYDRLGNYYTSAQTDNKISQATSEIINDLDANTWAFAYNVDLTGHTNNASIHRTSAQTQSQINDSLAPYYTSAQTYSKSETYSKAQVDTNIGTALYNAKQYADEKLTHYVSIDSAETITAEKTFSANTYVVGDLVVSGNIVSTKEISAWGSGTTASDLDIEVIPEYTSGGTNILLCTIRIGSDSYEIWAPTSTSTPGPA